MEFIPLIASLIDVIGYEHTFGVALIILLAYGVYKLNSLSNKFSSFVKDHEKVHDKIGNTLDEVKADVKNLTNQISDLEKHQAIIETKLDERTKG